MKSQTVSLANRDETKGPRVHVSHISHCLFTSFLKLICDLHGGTLIASIQCSMLLWSIKSFLLSKLKPLFIF